MQQRRIRGDDPREQPDGEQHELLDAWPEREWRDPPVQCLAPQGSSRASQMGGFSGPCA